jgi:HSP20 family protein
MAALVPRLMGDISEWLDAELPVRAGHLIRLEDHLTDTEYQLRAELPGMDPEKDIQVRVDDGVLSIHAERREREQAKGRSEFRYGMLQRSVRLPAGADEKHISAAYSKGILQVTVPLTPGPPAGRTIPVSRA